MMVKKDWTKAPAKERIAKIVEVLEEHYDAVCGLTFENPFQLLIATVLSAQCTDERVNTVTPALFKKYPNAKILAKAAVDDVEEIIRSTGFFRQKTKSIITASQGLVVDFNGTVPEDMTALVKLPGIGRKTANVVLGTAYGHPAITVDTHVKRLSNRLGLTTQSNPDKIEQDLRALVPEKDQTDFSHRLIWHGRKVCNARKPNCGGCPLAQLCPSDEKK